MKILKSRTVWAVIALFVINGFTGIRESIPVGWLPYLDGVLGLLAIYFRANPKQEF